MKPLRRLLGLAALSAPLLAWAGNPIIPQRGVCDPHIHIFNGRAYLYATHDRGADSKGFFMDEWGVWSSDDLVNWKLENVLKPEQTHLGRPFNQCWATDAATRNGKYYFYFSEGNEQTGVVVGDTPTGPWRDPLGRPLLTKDLTPTHEYDISVFTDRDHTPYLVFGVWDYHIARLGEDMVSLAEKPRAIEIIGAVGPYGPGRTDDKPFLHRRGDIYYLSWGVFYATASSPYGPYTYRGTIMDDRSFQPGTMAPTWPHGYRQGRHGSFFEWNNQWYFAYCDISQTDNRYFRDTFISYIHYRANGEMAPIRVDRTGVGQYDPALAPIQAEDYFAAAGTEKIELPVSGFGVVPAQPGALVRYPNVAGLAGQRSLTVTFVSLAAKAAEVVVEVALAADPAAPAVATLTLPAVPFQQTATARVDLALPADARDLVLRVPAGSRDVALDSLTLSPKPTSQLSPHRLFRLPSN
jgi:arabinoxylan arabinofuranohydrolase